MCATANEIARLLGVDAKFIEDDSGQIGLIVGDKYTPIATAMDGLKLVSKVTVISCYNIFKHGSNEVLCGSGVILAVTQGKTGWCHVNLCGHHPAWCNRRHDGKITRADVSFGLIETIEVNGEQRPHRYTVDGGYYSPAEWALLEKYPPYVPKDTIFPALITLPDGNQVQCETIYHVPREPLTLEWVLERGLVPNPRSSAEQRLAEWREKQAKLALWNAAHADLAKNRLNLGFDFVILTREQRAVISNLLYENMPHVSPPTVFAVADFC